MGQLESRLMPQPDPGVPQHAAAQQAALQTAAHHHCPLPELKEEAASFKIAPVTYGGVTDT